MFFFSSFLLSENIPRQVKKKRNVTKSCWFFSLGWAGKGWLCFFFFGRSSHLLVVKWNGSKEGKRDPSSAKEKKKFWIALSQQWHSSLSLQCQLGGHLQQVHPFYDHSLPPSLLSKKIVCVRMNSEEDESPLWYVWHFAAALGGSFQSIGFFFHLQMTPSFPTFDTVAPLSDYVYQ